MPDRDYSTQRVILGTHTSENEQNHLIIAGERTPLQQCCATSWQHVCVCQADQPGTKGSGSTKGS